jgi:hypothetical protein
VNQPKRASEDAYDGLSLDEIVVKLQTDYPEPADGDFTVPADLWSRMVALATGTAIVS